MSDTVYYAIGDVHGEAEKLAALHDFVREDAVRLGARPFFVHLGDLIDRGPDSRGVVARIMALHEAMPDNTVALKGNHEDMMLNAYSGASAMDESNWSVNGGDVAIASYERANGSYPDWRDSIDRTHAHWLSALPVMWRDEARKLVFVHAGIDPWRFPNCPDEHKLWTRSRKFFDTNRWPERPELEGLMVVHGHTPTDDFEPYLGPRRINVDTGACFGGPLTCVVLAPDETPRFLFAR